MNRMTAQDPDPATAASPRASAIDRTAQERLRRSSYLALRDVSCIVGDGVVYLHGSLPSHYLKQVAQEIAAGVEGVSRVINRIEVFPAARRAPSSRETGSTRSD